MVQQQQTFTLQLTSWKKTSTLQLLFLLLEKLEGLVQRKERPAATKCERRRVFGLHFHGPAKLEEERGVLGFGKKNNSCNVIERSEAHDHGSYSSLEWEPTVEEFP
ncbi:hypothetical protein LR48_Vigan07g172100 [Vigna angularis]|uniref:Uncharacterized protein n=1 Tax=Phaseolus angularis TaxID=3914 RepID=A0A0L9UZL6_PHAAN|nr:hypothetical protein LR48_Vigan07g172100 [Vigna angularis]